MLVAEQIDPSCQFTRLATCSTGLAGSTTLRTTSQLGAYNTITSYDYLQKCKWSTISSPQVDHLSTVMSILSINQSINQIKPNWFYHFTVVLVFINNFINPFVYAAKYREFQQGVRRMMSKVKGQHQSQVSTTTWSEIVVKMFKLFLKWLCLSK